MKCKATTCKGRLCKNQAEPSSIYCSSHIKQKAFVFDQKVNDEARAEMKAYWKRHEAWYQIYPGQSFPDSFPDSYLSMVCGAKTRAGAPCKRTDLYSNCRCRLHGGLSTGPQTKEGKRKVANNFPWARNEQGPGGEDDGCNGG